VDDDKEPHGFQRIAPLFDAFALVAEMRRNTSPRHRTTKRDL
jgi:hypothetical protein